MTAMSERDPQKGRVTISYGNYDIEIADDFPVDDVYDEVSNEYEGEDPEDFDYFAKAEEEDNSSDE